MATFSVTIPVAGHAYIEVEADDAAAAIDKALLEVELQHIDNWEPLRRLNQGNVCYCPQPWDAEAEQVD